MPLSKASTVVLVLVLIATILHKQVLSNKKKFFLIQAHTISIEVIGFFPLWMDDTWVLIFTWFFVCFVDIEQFETSYQVV